MADVTSSLHQRRAQGTESSMLGCGNAEEEIEETGKVLSQGRTLELQSCWMIL